MCTLAWGQDSPLSNIKQEPRHILSLMGINPNLLLLVNFDMLSLLAFFQSDFVSLGSLSSGIKHVFAHTTALCSF